MYPAYIAYSSRTILAEPYTWVCREFYPFYLGEHSNRTNRMMHLLGTSASVLSTSRVLLALIPLVMIRLGLPLSDEIRRLGLNLTEARTIILRGIGIGYGCAWIGHFFVEKNRPATFKVRADDTPSISFGQAYEREFAIVSSHVVHGRS